MLKKLKNIFKRKKGQEKVKGANLYEKFDRVMEAITFAEAGGHEHAREVMKLQEQERAKILVVGHEDSFSEPLAGYAVGLAERMGYEIIALNATPIISNSPKLISPFSEKIRQDFWDNAAKGVQELQSKAVVKGIPFKHMVKFGEIDESIKEVHDEFRGVDFVLREPEATVKGEEGSKAIPVYSITS